MSLLFESPSVISDLVEHFKLDAECHDDHTLIFTRIRGRRNAKKEEKWVRTKAVGQGSFGTVWLEQRVDDELGEELRAVKEIRKCLPNQGSFNLDYSRELYAMAKLTRDVDHFAEFFGWYEDNDHVFLSMEYFKYGDLGSHLTNPFAESEVKEITLQLLSGLEIIHKYGLVHRDLKPQNVFVVQKTPTWWVKIGDFGISKKMTDQTPYTAIGTDPFMAPEILDEDNINGYTEAVDIWSLGCMVYLLVTSNVPFQNQKNVRQFADGNISFPTKHLDEAGARKHAVSFLKHLLSVQPKSRPSATEAARARWFKEEQAGISLEGHAERWEKLSEHWESIISHTLRKLQANTDKFNRGVSEKDITQQIQDLAAAGSNLFHAVVELQRLRSSAERKFQRAYEELQAERKDTEKQMNAFLDDLQQRSQKMKHRLDEVLPSETSDVLQHVKSENSLHSDGKEKPGRLHYLVDRERIQ